YYDLPSNAAVANRIVRNSDGTISATWTETCNQSGPNYTNRGAGYNYYDGTKWTVGATSNPREFTGSCTSPGTSPSKAFGIASKRVGWPEMLVLPNGKKGVIAHSLNDGISFTSRPAKGTGG